MTANIQISSVQLKTAGLVYITMPVLLFLGCMLRPWIAVPSVLLALTALVVSIRFVRRSSDNDERSLSMSIWTILLVVGIVAGHCVLCGQFGLCVQVWDWFSRNATFRDLITHSWPVRYPNHGNTAMAFYFGHWLPAAFVGRGVLLATGSVDAAWRIGNFCLGLWTVAGVSIAFLLAGMRIGATSTGKMLVILPVLLSFCGCFFFGMWARSWLTGSVPAGSWAGCFEFTTNEDLLSWVFHQTVVPWIATALLWEEGRKAFPYMLFVLADIPLCGPFPATGLGWMVATVVVVELYHAVRDGRILKLISEVVTIPNAVGVIVVVPLVASMLFANSASGMVGPSWTGVASRKLFAAAWVAFFCCEVGVYGLALLRREIGNPYFWGCFSYLAVCPLVKIGHAHDFCMRASIPALFGVMIMCLGLALHGGRKFMLERLAVLICLVLCAYFYWNQSVGKIRSTIACYRTGRPVACDPLYTYDRDFAKFPISSEADRMMLVFSDHFYCKDPQQSVFFRHLAKDPQ